MTAADAWNLDIRIASVLAGLGLGGLAEAPARSREPASLSPGQRGRLALAAALIARPAALVLDEPTNHLDDGAIAFLSETLHGWEGPVLLASHDRAFIDDIATCVLDLDTAPWQALLTASGGGRVPGVHRCAGACTDYYLEGQGPRSCLPRAHPRRPAGGQARPAGAPARVRDHRPLRHRPPPRCPHRDQGLQESGPPGSSTPTAPPRPPPGGAATTTAAWRPWPPSRCAGPAPTACASTRRRSPPATAWRSRRAPPPSPGAWPR